MSQLTMTLVPVGQLKPHSCNPRSHSKKQIKQIARSMEEFGFVAPVLVDAENRIIAGHGRLEAAKLQKMKEVPTVCVSHLTEAQVRAYMVADNKLAENADWDTTMLGDLIKELESGLHFDPTILGFDTPELDALTRKEPSPDLDKVPQVDRSKPAVSRRGDVWRIGNHLVTCGDATDTECYRVLLDGERARMIFTDPPYNVRIAGNVSGLGRAQHGEFQMASGEMAADEFKDFLETVFGHLNDFSEDGSLHYVCMDWRHMWEIMCAGRSCYAELKNLCVWNKTNGGMGAFYRSQHELVFVFKHGTAAHINNVELGKHGRNRTNVWTYGGANAFGVNRNEELALHPTVKPVALIADAILDASNRKDIILDVFGGSGSTLLAAEETKRRGRAIEIDPYYVDTIIRRLSAALKTEATLSGSNQSFDLIRKWRESGFD